MLNGGYLMGCVLFRNQHLAVVFLVTPAVLGCSLASYPEVNWFLKHFLGPGSANDVFWLVVLNLIAYGFLPFVMWFSSVGEFVKAAGRPNRKDVAGRTRALGEFRVQGRAGKPLRGEHFPEMQ